MIAAIWVADVNLSCARAAGSELLFLAEDAREIFSRWQRAAVVSNRRAWRRRRCLPADSTPQPSLSVRLVSTPPGRWIGLPPSPIRKVLAARACRDRAGPGR